MFLRLFCSYGWNQTFANMGVDFLFSLFLNGKSGDNAYVDPMTGKNIDVPAGKTLADIDPETARFYNALGDTKVTGELHTAIGDMYAQYLDIPESIVPRNDFRSLETAYRNYETNATVKNAAAFLDEAGKVYTLAGDGGYKVGNPYETANATIEADFAARQGKGAGENTKRVDSFISLEDNNSNGIRTKNNLTHVPYGDQYKKGINGRKELKPNVSYASSDGYRYSTDEFGRVDNIEGVLVLGIADRNEYAQRVVGREDRIKNIDEGGHLIARIFRGSGDIDNLVPMDATLNHGEWRIMENSWK